MIINTNPCSYNIVLTDTTVVSNPYLSSKGSIIWEIFRNNTWELLGYSALHGTLAVELCQGVWQIRCKYQIRLIQNCGGISPVIFETNYENNSVTLTDRNFTFSLPTVTTCLYTNKTFFYNFNLTSLCATNTTISVYKDNVFITTYTRTDNTVNFVFTEVGTYKLSFNACNCCYCQTDIIYVTVCNTVMIEPSDDCLKPYLINSNNTTLHFNIYQKIDNVETFVSSGDISPNTRLPLDFKKEGYYYLAYNNFKMDLPLFCKLDQCMKKLIESFMCTSGNCGCLTVTGTQDIDRLIRIKTLAELYYKGINKTFNIPFNISNNLLDWNNNLLEKFSLQEIYDKAIEYCEPCKINNCNCK